MNLFPKEHIAGIFRGFSGGGLEFHADIILPYQDRFQAMPMHGLLVAVQLENEDEAVIGRITSVSAKGRLSSGAGEDFGIRAVSEGRPVPEDLREQYLKYEVDIRVLGVIRSGDGDLVFASSHRRLPHVGSKVGFLSEDVLHELCGHNDAGAEIGHLALGEYVFASGDRRLRHRPWMQVIPPAVVPRFDVNSLVSRRTFIFARAGFGKSNLVKLLFGHLYKTTPTVTKRSGKNVPVGSVIFDPEGEYYWPDDKHRPGLCDVPELQDQAVVFTPKAAPSKFYGSFIGGSIKLDIRRLRPIDVISIALSPERQSQQNVRKLVGLTDTNWRTLVDLIHKDRHGADEHTIRELLGLNAQQDAELYAARANMVHVVNMLHDPSSQMLDTLMRALRDGKLCVVDISQMRGNAGLTLSGIILRRIFEHNQNEFTKAEPETIPTIAVVEEAQSVLGSSGEASEGPYIEWVKEGRKYDLGAVLITQQPGSISNEILSQGDNWFVFHLLSSGDLACVRKANAHFSDDLLSSLLNEPIPGHGIFWTSSKERPIPVSVRVLSFEEMYEPLDASYERGFVETYASQLRARMRSSVGLGDDRGEGDPASPVDLGQLKEGEAQSELSDDVVDVLEIYSSQAINGFEADVETLKRLRGNGVPWKGVLEALKSHLPHDLQDREKMAHNLVPRALDHVCGPESEEWSTERRPSKSGSGYTTWVVIRQ